MDEIKVGDRVVVTMGTMIPQQVPGIVEEIDFDKGEYRIDIYDGDFTHVPPDRVKLADMTPLEFADNLRHLIERRKLEIDPYAVPIIALCAAVGTRDGVLNRFWAKLDQITMGGDHVKLWPDGLPRELSFGIGWYRVTDKIGEDNQTALQTKWSDKAFMVGGLIYRGPERNNDYKEHSWSVHT
jgi:hypothetical protein